LGSRYYLILLLTLTLLGCRPATPIPTAPAVTETVVATLAPTAAPMPEDAAIVRDAPYQLGTTDSLKIVQLKDGKFEQGAPGGADYISVQMTDFAATGNLDADGKNEIATLVSENLGGTGVFVFLAIYKNVNGIPTFLTSAIVDDRPQLNALSIEKDEIRVDAIIHGASDPMCCPTLHTTRRYRLVNDQLDMTNLTTFTPDDKPRTIEIQAPLNNTEVFNSILVKGSVAIAPFENNLAYSIKDGVGVELSRGSIDVKAADPGGPGTFEAVIPLGNILSSAVIFLEVQDISAADGSLMGMDSVQLVVK
jgi:immunoglobulin-like protein involved in spore germination